MLSLMEQMKKQIAPVLVAAAAVATTGAKPRQGAQRTAVPAVTKNVEAPEYSKNPTLSAVEKQLHAQQWLITKHEYHEKNLLEAEIRRPSLTKPRGYTELPLTITAIVKAEGNATVLLPCPRDIMDQQHVATKVTVSLENGDEIPVDAKIVYANADQENAYQNPFVLSKLNAKGRCLIRAAHVINIAEYAVADGRQYMQGMDPAFANKIVRAIQTASALPYNANINGMDPTLADKHGAGDCGVKAAVARRLGDGAVDVLEGYSFRETEVDEKYGGRHALNIVRTPQGLMTFDARSRKNCYIGPMKGFIPTQIGGNNLIKEWSKNRIHNTNGGYYSNCNIEQMATLSVPGFGPDGEALKRMEIPDNVKQYAAALWKERMRQYEGAVSSRN